MFRVQWGHPVPWGALVLARLSLFNFVGRHGAMTSMIEMPFHLRILLEESRDILRFFGTQDTAASYDTGTIIDGSGLSERGFRKGLRGLINKKMLTMSGDGVYRLTEPGRRAVADLQEWDRIAPQHKVTEARFVLRRLFAAAPRTLISGQPAHVLLGFDEADDEEILEHPVDLLIQVTALDGTVENAVETEKSLRLHNRHVRQPFEIVGGRYTKLRVRVAVIQPGVNDDEPGGLYFDVPVTADPDDGDSALVAYAANVLIRAE
ncbi:MAG: hypothetical protein SF162_07740 [bacterium]|nr:hypothetical protein [bacterium]